MEAMFFTSTLLRMGTLLKETEDVHFRASGMSVHIAATARLAVLTFVSFGGTIYTRKIEATAATKIENEADVHDGSNAAATLKCKMTLMHLMRSGVLGLR